MKNFSKSFLFIVLVTIILGSSFLVGCKNPFMPDSPTSGGTPPVKEPVFTPENDVLPEQRVDAKEPNLTSQPMNQEVTSGVKYTVQVSAESLDGGTLTYQWYESKSDDYKGTKISDATGDSYTTSYDLGEGGNEKIFYYYVEVTNTL